MLRRQPAISLLCALFSLLLCATPAVPAVAQAQTQHVVKVKKKTFKQQITQLEAQWRQAQLTNDADTIERLLSDDYIGINAQGMVSTKAQAVARIQARQATINTMDVQDQKIAIHGDTAVVTSQVEVDITNNATQPATHVHSRLRYTRVYLHYPSGAWRIVNFESTHISDLPGLTEPPAGKQAKP